MKIKSYIFSKGEKIDIDFIPNLAFLFFEEEKILLECHKKLKLLNSNIEVIGIKTNKMSINNQIPFIIDSSKISLLLFNIDNFFINSYKISDFKLTKQQFLQNYKQYKNTASIMFFPLQYDANKFLDFIQDEYDMNNLYGGVYSLDKNSCFYNGEFFNDKIVSVFFDQNKIEFFSVAIQGWSPIGVEFKVTKSYKNIVYEIDYEPALNIIEDYIGEIKQENIDNFLHPFCVKHNGYISLASIKSINKKNNSIEFYKYIYENEKIKIAIPNNQKTMMKIIDNKLKNIKCDGLFMFSCIGRYAYYKDLLEFEIAKVADSLKVPFAGFCSYGEIGSNSVNEKSILQNQTMNLIFFKEKQ